MDVTVSSTFHWLDQERFFEECRHVLRSEGWLAIYDHFLVGVEGRPEYLEWVQDVYLSRYPAPVRGPGFGPQSALPRGYRRVGQKKYEDPRVMTRAEFVEYHLSQSIALMGMRRRGETVAKARAWLDSELEQFIPGEAEAIVQFVGTVSCLELE